MSSLVIYSSLTGNTEKIAQAIYEEIKGEKTICRVGESIELKDYNTIFLGFWVDKGTATESIIEFLRNIHNK